MHDPQIAVIGIGATGVVLAAALLKKYPKTVLVGRNPDLGQALLKDGLHVTGELNIHVPVNHYLDQILKLKDFGPQIIFIAGKTFHLPGILDELQTVAAKDSKIVSIQNGLGVEDLIADKFGLEAAFRMSLNFGAALKGPGQAEMTFFNRPNHIGCLTPENANLGRSVAEGFSEVGLETEYVDDIKHFVWKKMIMKCTMASICAVTDKTIKEALAFPPTREIAEACFKEIMAVARAKGYDFGDDYLKQAVGYIEKVGVHKDSMCVDIANQTRTEIDYLGAKVVAYGREKGVPTPVFMTMTNLVKALDAKGQ